MKKKLLKILILAMILCLSACGENNEIEEETPISDPEAFMADLYGDKDIEDEDDKDIDYDDEDNTEGNKGDYTYNESEKESSSQYIDNDNNDNNDYSDSDSAIINTTSYEYNGSVLYKPGKYIYIMEQYCTKAYMSSDFSEALGVFSYSVPYYADTMKQELYDYVYETLEENYGSLTKKGTYVNSNDHEFEIFEYRTNDGNYGVIYLTIEGDTSAAIIGSSIYGSMSDDFNDVLDSVIIQ